MQNNFALLVDRFAQSPNDSHAARIREEIARQARPIAVNALRNFRVEPDDLEDLGQQCLLQFLEALDRARAEGRPIPAPCAYLRTIAQRCLVDRRRGPRDAFAKSLVYCAQRYDGLAVWTAYGGETMLGLAEHAGAAIVATPEFMDFERDPGAFVHQALDGECPARVPRPRLLLAVLRRLGTPVPRSLLANRLADVLGIGQREVSIEAVEETATAATPSPGIGRLDAIWGAMQDLGRNALASFLLARSQDEVEALAGGRDPRALVGSALGCDDGESARVWQAMPLADAEIAQRLGTSRQNVHTMRSRAVAKLRGELATWRREAM